MGFSRRSARWSSPVRPAPTSMTTASSSSCSCYDFSMTRFLRSAVLAAPLLAGASALAQQSVKIGFASPLTGPQAHYGVDNRNGAQMAIDELNTRSVALGGRPVKFELVAEDDQADPKTGTIAAQRLVDA